MIYLGLTTAEKRARIADYCAAHAINYVVLLSPAPFAFPCDAVERVETVGWQEIIMYRIFYPIQERIAGNRTLVVVNECLRTQNRHDLTYNCIRHYLSHSPHVLVFQWLPLIDTIQDFMILLDFATRSRWKTEAFDEDLLSHAQVYVAPRVPVITATEVAASAKVRATYDAERDKLFASLGGRDPHTLPRNLHLVSGKDKLAHVDPGRAYIGRNNRFKIDNMATYKEGAYPAPPYTAFDFPHNFVDFSDFLSLAGQERVDALTTDLKVDQWYLVRYAEWAKRIEDGYSSLSARA